MALSNIIMLFPGDCFGCCSAASCAGERSYSLDCAGCLSGNFNLIAVAECRNCGVGFNLCAADGAFPVSLALFGAGGGNVLNESGQRMLAENGACFYNLFIVADSAGIFLAGAVLTVGGNIYSAAKGMGRFFIDRFNNHVCRNIIDSLIPAIESEVLIGRSLCFAELCRRGSTVGISSVWNVLNVNALAFLIKENNNIGIFIPLCIVGL